MTEGDELIENGDESGARRLLLAELVATRKAGGTCRRLQYMWLAGDGFVWLIRTIDNEGVLPGTEGGDCVQLMATMSAGNGSGRQMPAGICPTSSDSYNNSCPTRLARLKERDYPRVCGSDFWSRLRPSREDAMTGKGKTGPLTKLLRLARWLKRMMSALCGWTLTTTGIVGSRSETQSSRATPPPFPHGIWTRPLLP